jgi:hypothetical protein
MEMESLNNMDTRQCSKSYFKYSNEIICIYFMMVFELVSILCDWLIYYALKGQSYSPVLSGESHNNKRLQFTVLSKLIQEANCEFFI